METLRYGIVGSGFVAQFHLRALESVRGVEVAGLTSRTPPHELAASVRERGLGRSARVRQRARRWRPTSTWSRSSTPTSCRVEVMEEIAAAVRDGATLRGLICEKPLARNLAEARRVIELASEIGAPTAYFENQIHMKMLQQARAAARRSRPRRWARSRWCARPRSTAARTARWFWDPTQQGGGVLSDMGCHSIAVGRYLLTPGRPADALPRAANRSRRT